MRATVKFEASGATFKEAMNLLINEWRVFLDDKLAEFPRDAEITVVKEASEELENDKKQKKYHVTYVSRAQFDVDDVIK